ncbi:MAG: class I SAM-dependent methyltransferase [Dongiaceae bacterium]
MPSIYSATDARAYERLMGRWSRHLADELLRFAGPAPGERLLDLGCGTGSLSAALAARAEPAAIVGLDIAAPDVAFAAARLADPRLGFCVGDAQRLPFPAAAFDRSLSLLALNFVADPAAAVAELVRVTRPGGTVAATVWDLAGGLVYQRLFWDTAAALDPAADRARARQLSLPLTTPGALAGAFRAAGLAEVAEASLMIRMTYADFADFWAPITGGQGPVGDYVRSVDPDLLGRIAERVRAAYLAGRPDGPRSMAAVAWAARGRVTA